MQTEYAIVMGGNSIERTGLSSILCQEGLDFNVIEFDHFEPLRDIMKITRPGLVVVDANLEGWRSSESIGSMLSVCSDIKVCVAVDRLTRDIAAECVAAGAVGCIERTQAADEVRQAFETIVQGGMYLHMAHPDHHTHFSADTGTRPVCDLSELTPRQRSVLQVMALGKSNKEIARELGIREGTVKVHLVAAYRSLGVRNRVAAVHAINSQIRSVTANDHDGPMLPMPGLGHGTSTVRERRLAN